MNKIYKYLIVSLLSLFLINCSSANELKSNKFENSEVRVYEVFGMDCPGCHGGVEKLLNQHKDVLGSEADWVNKKVTLYLVKNSKISEEEIFELIKNANFTPGKRIK